MYSLYSLHVSLFIVFSVFVFILLFSLFGYCSIDICCCVLGVSWCADSPRFNKLAAWFKEVGGEVQIFGHTAANCRQQNEY